MKIAQVSTAFLAVALLISTVNSRAQTSPESTPSSLTGTSWQLVQFQSSDDTTLTPADRTKYTLAFEANGRLSARVDCNRGMGSWSASADGQLHLGPLALTRVMCPPAPLTDRFARDLEHVRSYILRNGHLFLALKIDSGIYEFEPLSAASSTASSPATPLENTNWKLVQLGTKPVTGADPQRAPYIMLSSADHRVSGSGGCNRIIGGYTLEGNRIKFPHLGASMMACDKGMDTEQAFLSALNQVNSWKITGDKLEFFDPADKTVATFQSVR